MAGYNPNMDLEMDETSQPLLQEQQQTEQIYDNPVFESNINTQYNTGETLDINS
jgi:hypothetical protein